MKRITSILSVVAAALFIWALPVFADSGTMGQRDKSSQRDECLLVAQLDKADCQNRSESIGDRISRLDREIAKGTQVYTPEELKYLNKERSQFIKMRDYVNGNAPDDQY